MGSEIYRRNLDGTRGEEVLAPVLRVQPVPRIGPGRHRLDLPGETLLERIKRSAARGNRFARRVLRDLRW